MTSPNNDPTQQFPKRSTRCVPRAALLIGAGVAALLVAGGGVAWALTDSTQPAAATTVAASDATHSTHEKRRAHVVVGTVTAENGDNWTVTTPRGRTITVTIVPTTLFGTKKNVETRDDIAVGAKVAVRGAVTSNAVTATRIVERPVHAASQAPIPG